MRRARTSDAEKSEDVGLRLKMFCLSTLTVRSIRDITGTWVSCDTPNPHSYEHIGRVLRR